MLGFLINTIVRLTQMEKAVSQALGNLTKMEQMNYHWEIFFFFLNHLQLKMNTQRYTCGASKRELLQYKLWRIECCQKFMQRNESLPDGHHFPNGLLHAVVVWIMSFMQIQSAVQVHGLVNSSCLSRKMKTSDSLANEYCKFKLTKRLSALVSGWRTHHFQKYLSERNNAAEFSFGLKRSVNVTLIIQGVKSCSLLIYQQKENS